MTIIMTGLKSNILDRRRIDASMMAIERLKGNVALNVVKAVLRWDE